MDRITTLKAEIFDLQIKLGTTRKEMEAKLAELNKLIKDGTPVEIPALKDDPKE